MADFGRGGRGGGINPITAAWDAFNSGNWWLMALGTFALTAFYFGADAGWNGLNGRACEAGWNDNPPFSQVRKIACMGRGALEAAFPDHKKPQGIDEAP